MFEKFLSGNIDSFRQRYENTYGFYRDGKKKILVMLSSVNNDEVVFVDSRGIDYRLHPDSENNIGFEFIPPRSQWYNTKVGAVFTERVAQRQYSRGVCDRNLRAGHLHSGRTWNQEINFETLAAIYTQERGNASYVDEFINGSKKLKSAALSAMFAMDDIGTLFVLKEPVGTWVNARNGKVQFKLNEPDLWKVELNDAWRALALNREMEVV